MYKKTIFILALFAVIISWSASNAKLFLREIELKPDLEFASTKKTTHTQSKITSISKLASKSNTAKKSTKRTTKAKKTSRPSTSTTDTDRGSTRDIHSDDAPDPDSTASAGNKLTWWVMLSILFGLCCFFYCACLYCCQDAEITEEYSSVREISVS